MGRARRRAGRRAARRRPARVLPRTTCARPAATARTCSPSPKRSILTEKAVTGRSAWERLFDELTSAITVDLDGEHRDASKPGSSRLHVARPRRAARRGRGGHRRRSSPGCARARSCSTRCSPTSRSTTGCATSTAGSRAATSPTRRATSRCRRSSTRCRAATTIPQRWYALKAQLLGIDRLADYDRMASVADVESEIGWDEAQGARARRVRVVLAASSPTPRSGSSTSAWIDAPVAPGQAARRVLRVHGAVAPPVPAAQLDVAPPRRAHARARARARPARVPRARAGRLPPDDAAHARRDRVGVRRDGHVRPAARRRSTDPARAARAARRRTSRTRSRPCSARSR